MYRAFIIAAAVLLLLLCGPTGASSQACSSLFLRFQRQQDPGLASFVTDESAAAGTTHYFRQLQPIPAIVVYLSYADRLTGATTLLQEESAQVVTVRSTPAVQLRGNTIAMSAGVAVFPAITPQGPLNASLLYTLAFAVSGHDAAPLQVSFSFGGAPTINTLSFGNQGFLYRQGMPRTVPTGSGATWPRFSLVITNAYGIAETITSLFTILANCTSGTVQATPIPAGTEVTYSDFRFIPRNATVATTVCTFTARSRAVAPSTTPTLTLPLTTGVLTLVQTPTRSQFLLFDPAASASYLTMENAAGDAVLDIALRRIRLVFYTSLMQPDTSVSGLVVVATCKEGTLKGNAQAADQGVVTFDQLMFTGGTQPPAMAVLTFTAGVRSDVPLSGSVLYSGPVAVAAAPIVAALMTFAPSSEVGASGAISIPISFTKSFSIPTIKVQMRDSAYQLDPTLSDLTLQLSLSACAGTTDAIFTSGSSAVLASGQATFTNIQCSNGRPGPVRVCVIDPSGARPQLCSSCATPVTLRAPISDARAGLQQCASSAAGCLYALSFGAAPISHVTHVGASLFATVGVQLPQVLVVLSDVFGPTSQLSDEWVPVLVAFTGSTPASAEGNLLTSNGANVAVYRNGVYLFTCLQFVRVPRGTVTIKFAAVASDGSMQALPGYAVLETGFVAVEHTTVLAYALRFAPAESLLTWAGHATSAVVNTALPPVVVQVLDSAGSLDTTANNIVLACSTSSGAIARDGSLETVVNGVAVFSLLSFTSLAQAPILTFRAQRSTAAVAGKSVSSGVITVTYRPISAYEIAFASVLSYNNNVTSNFQSFLFPTIQNLLVLSSIVLRNSAHEVETSSSAFVSLVQLSTEGTLTTSAIIDIAQGSPRPSANFSAQASGWQPRYQHAPIYLRYVVKDSSSPNLVGQVLTIGPIVVSNSPDTQTCTAQLHAPLVTLRLAQPLTLIEANLPVVQSQLADQLNIHVSQVILSNPRAEQGLDVVRMAPREGSRVDVQFQRSPTASSAQLAAQLVQLRPPCATPAPQGAGPPPAAAPAADPLVLRSATIRGAFYKSQERSCNAESFLAGQLLAGNCTLTQLHTQCQCYTIYVLGPYGALCATEPTLASAFTEMCTTLKECAEIDVVVSCKVFLVTPSLFKSVYLAILAVLVIPVIVGLVLLRRRRMQKVVLNSDQKTREEESDLVGALLRAGRGPSKPAEL